MCLVAPQWQREGAIMGNEQPKRAVLIGAGMVARTHVAACAHALGVTVHGIHSRSPDRARALAEEGGAQTGSPVHVYESLDAVAADPDVDFAIVLTPPNARIEIIRVLAAAGKHILLEKPVGRNAAEAREIVSFCREAGVTLGVVFQHRMRGASRKAAQMIAMSDLGALGLVEISVPWWRDQRYYDEPGRGTYGRDGGGVLISQAIHTIDLALSLAGPVHSVRAMATTTRFHQMEAEDFVTAGLQFANGAVGSLVASTASFPGGAETITLHFEKASLRLGSGQLHVSWRDGQEERFGAKGGTGGGADPMAFTHEWHQSVIEDFAAALARGGQPAITGEDALAAHDLIDAIITSARSGKVTELSA
jgi:predicted dehydrogenase